MLSDTSPRNDSNGLEAAWRLGFLNPETHFRVPLIILPLVTSAPFNPLLLFKKPGAAARSGKASYRVMLRVRNDEMRSGAGKTQDKGGRVGIESGRLMGDPAERGQSISGSHPKLHSNNSSASQGTSPEKTYPAGIIVRLNATWYETVPGKPSLSSLKVSLSKPRSLPRKRRERTRTGRKNFLPNATKRRPTYVAKYQGAGKTAVLPVREPKNPNCHNPSLGCIITAKGRILS